MSKISLSPSPTGSAVYTIASPAGSTDRTLTIPDSTTTLVGTDATQTLTNKTLGSGLVMGASTITSGTSQASTSGTSIDFTSIPSYVKRVTVLGAEVSTNGTSALLIQLGDSGGVETTGYLGGMFGNVNQTNSSTSGVVLLQTSNSAASNHSFSVVFNSESSNKWVALGTTTRNDGALFFTGSFKSLSATLDRVRITTVNGTDTFDAGSINIFFE